MSEAFRFLAPEEYELLSAEERLVYLSEAFRYLRIAVKDRRREEPSGDPPDSEQTNPANGSSRAEESS